MSSRWTDPIDVSDSDSDSSDSPVLVHQQSSSAHSALKPLPVPDDFSDDDDDDVQFVSAKPSAKPLGGFSRIETATYEETTAELNAMADDADKLAESISKLNVDEQYTVDDLVFEMGELELDRQHADVYATSQPSDYHTTHTDRRYYSSKTDGDEIFGMMMMFLAVLPLTLSYLQKLFITLALNVLAPIIYGEEWRTRTEEVMKKRGWSDLNPLMAAICARRFGKTVAVGILAAMLLMCVPGVKIAVFAPSHKQAVALLKNAVDVLRSHPWWGNYRVNSMTQQKWEIIGPDGSIRSISAYASKHKVTIHKMEGGGGINLRAGRGRPGHKRENGSVFFNSGTLVVRCESSRFVCILVATRSSLFYFRAQFCHCRKIGFKRIDVSGAGRR